MNSQFKCGATNVQRVEVFRYYCHNPACEKSTFTNLPPGLTPYSPYRVETHLLAVQLYAWSYSTYRRTATALDVAPFTIGYTLHTVVTDLRQDYGPIIARVFPKAAHHECVFHALQNVQAHFKAVYDPDYAKTNPQAMILKQQIYTIFETRTERVTCERYAAVLAKQDAYAIQTSEAIAIFEFLEHHWPKLVNASRIPPFPAPTMLPNSSSDASISTIRTSAVSTTWKALTCISMSLS